MRIKEIETLIHHLSPKFYKFAFALYPDELLAQQLVIDAMSLELVSKTSFFNQNKIKDDQRRLAQRQFRLRMFSRIFNIAVSKVSSHIEKEMDVPQEYLSFYKLPISQRAILFLKVREGLNEDSLSAIFNIKRAEVIAGIASAKNILEKIGHNPSGYYSEGEIRGI